MKGNVLKGLGLLACLAAGPAFAHHSGAMFDRAKTVELKGTIKQFGWTNPHAYIAIDVPNAQAPQRSGASSATARASSPRRG